MATIENLKKRATALSGSPPPGDARAVARVLHDLCEYITMLNDAVPELIRQMREAQTEIAELKKLIQQKS